MVQFLEVTEAVLASGLSFFYFSVAIAVATTQGYSTTMAAAMTVASGLLFFFYSVVVLALTLAMMAVVAAAAANLSPKPETVGYMPAVSSFFFTLYVNTYF